MTDDPIQNPFEAPADGADHPMAGQHPAGWSVPQADEATPGVPFARLVLKRHGAETDVVFPVNPPATIGRFDPTVGPIDVDLGGLDPEGTYVSRKHARIVFDENDGTYLLQDLGSSNGTYVRTDDFERVTELRLTDGMEVAFGNARFVFHV